VRGEHANVQYRINGVELPEGLSVFGQALESRFANGISLIESRSARRSFSQRTSNSCTELIRPSGIARKTWYSAHASQ